MKIIDDQGHVYEQHNTISNQFLNYLATFFYQPPNLPTGYGVSLVPTSVNVAMQINDVNYQITQAGLGVSQILEVEFVSNVITTTGTIEQLTLFMNTLLGTVIPVARFNVDNSPSVGTTIRVVWTLTFYTEVAGVLTLNVQNVQAVLANAIIPNASSVNSAWTLPSQQQTYVTTSGQSLYVLEQSAYGSSGAFSASVVGVPQQSSNNVVTVQVYSLGLLIATLTYNLSIFNVQNFNSTLLDIGFTISFIGA